MRFAVEPSGWQANSVAVGVSVGFDDPHRVGSDDLCAGHVVGERARPPW